MKKATKVKKVKFKSSSSLVKRFKVWSDGKVKRAHASTSHLFSNKTVKQKRQLRGRTYLDISDLRRLKPMIKF